VTKRYPMDTWLRAIRDCLEATRPGDTVVIQMPVPVEAVCAILANRRWVRVEPEPPPTKGERHGET
tara:strand:+ start:2415 stop:2612 length:198 start_codon:yes stop_codon:yes gene_type:complete